MGRAIGRSLSSDSHISVNKRAYTGRQLSYYGLSSPRHSMKILIRLSVIPLLAGAMHSMALSLSPEEFDASRKLACVLAQQSLGQLTEQQYGEKANTLLDGFDETERDNVLAQAVGYLGGVMFSSSEKDPHAMTLKMEDFVSSGTCKGDYSKVTLQL